MQTSLTLARTTKTNSMLMQNLMMDLLDLGKRENNNFKLNDVYFSLDEVIKKACSVVQHNADFKDVELVIRYTQ
jgi:signal transduction histidine kinase